MLIVTWPKNYTKIKAGITYRNRCCVFILFPLKSLVWSVDISFTKDINAQCTVIRFCRNVQQCWLDRQKARDVKVDVLKESVVPWRYWLGAGAGVGERVKREGRLVSRLEVELYTLVNFTAQIRGWYDK